MVLRDQEMENPKINRILVIEPNAAERRNLIKILRSYSDYIAQSDILTDVNSQIEASACELVFLPSEINGKSALTWIQKFRAETTFNKKNIPFILMGTQALSYAEQNLLQELSGVGFIYKPATYSRVISQILTTTQDARRARDLEFSILKASNELNKADDISACASLIENDFLRYQSDGVVALSQVLDSCNLKDKASFVLSRALLKNDKNPRLLEQLGMINIEQGNLEAGKKWLLKAHDLAPGKISRMREILQLALQMKDSEIIEKIFPASIDMWILSEREILQAIESLFEANMNDLVVKITNATKMHTEVIRLYNNKGIEKAKMERYAEAISDYEKAYSIAKGSTLQNRILFNIAIANINMKTSDSVSKAKEQLQEILRNDPEFQKARDTLQRLP